MTLDMKKGGRESLRKEEIAVEHIYRATPQLDHKHNSASLPPTSKHVNTHQHKHFS